MNYSVLTDAGRRAVDTIDAPLSPDGVRYGVMGNGQETVRPFHYRWLIPAICRMDARRWRTARTVSVISLIPLGFWYGHGGKLGLCVALVPVALAGVWTINFRFPVLVDAPAMALALTSACCAQQGWWILAAWVALVAGMTKETAPAFAALWSWSVWPLFGLASVAARAVMRSGPDPILRGDAHEALVHPFRTAYRFHRDSDPAMWLLPWGCLLVGLAHPTWQTAACCLAAYGQCLVATDRVRLYQWAWPVLAVQTFAVVPQAWWLFVLVAHFAHPWRTDGV